VTAGDRSFPLVLARTWHGVCRFAALSSPGGIVSLVSSKTARLRRRQVAGRKKDERLRKASRALRSTTQAKRMQAQAELDRQQDADSPRLARLQRAVIPVMTSMSAASFVFLASAEVSSGHYVYQSVSAAGLAWPGNPDLPHVSEPDMTFDTPIIEAGTARTDLGVLPWGPVSRNGSSATAGTGRTSSRTNSSAREMAA